VTRLEVRTPVFIDADNTLWDTNAVFADAQRAVLADVAHALGIALDASHDLDFIRAIDQAIASRHHAGLRYPVSLLIRGLELALDGASPEIAARTAWSGGRNYRIDSESVGEIESRYFEKLSALPALRGGVIEGLDWLRARGCLLYVVTEGAKPTVQRTADRLGLADYFDRVIAAPKTAELYQRVLRLAGAPRLAFMIGDQLDRDIAPANAAGLRTIYFPGGFQPKWLPGVEDAKPAYVVSSFSDVPEVLEREITQLTSR
jgi:putative hydrolase of the HAD superfamily